MNELDTLPLVKCVLTDKKGNDSLDVTKYIDEWENLEITMSRDGTSGVLSEVSMPINLVLAGKEFAKAIFERDGLYAGAVLEIYKRGDMSNDYAPVKEMPLDFSTYKEYDERVTVESAKSELLELINSEGKTKYNIPVKDLRENERWNYGRMEFVNIGEYELPMDEQSMFGNKYTPISFTMITTNKEQIPGERNIIKDQAFTDWSGDSFRENAHFFESASNESVTLTCTIKLSFDCLIQLDSASSSITESFSLAIITYPREYKHIGEFNVVKKWDLNTSHYSDAGGIRTFILNKKIDDKFNIKVNPSEFVSFLIIDSGTIARAVKLLEFSLPSFEKFQISYFSRSKNDRVIDVISPSKLLQKYVDLMTGEAGKYKAAIEWRESDRAEIMLVAAESIRQMDNATLHGSPNDFFDWMRVLGYEYEVSGNNLYFKRRDDFFVKSITAKQLQEDEVADLIIQANGEHAYTSVEIGYEKQDYESINGRCEANGTFEYTTGYITREDNKLSLISPYRADSIGIELLCQETDKDTTDKDSDNDIFCVALSKGNRFYETYAENRIEDKEIGLVMFNSYLNPYYLVERNKSLVGINSAKLKFKSTNMSRTAKISGVDIYGDWSIPGGLFAPVEYNIATGTHDKLPIDAKKNGLVKFAHKGNEYQGFIKEIRKNYAADTEETWVLMAVK